VPNTATSGIYFAKLVRLDTGEASPVVFIVRNDSGHSDILLQTSDSTWYAYNDYGGAIFMWGLPSAPSKSVTTGRPTYRVYVALQRRVSNASMARSNGYDLSYFTNIDSDRYGNLITQHKILCRSGHDEYWSGGQRANVEAARAVGVNLAFFSGNAIAWKTRWEPSIDGTTTSYRTLVCYKDTLANAGNRSPGSPKLDGAWRDQRFSPPADGGRPENALSGTISRLTGLERFDPRASG